MHVGAIVKNVLIFAERMLPSTQTFIPLQVAALTRYKPHYAGLIPAERNYPLADKPVLLTRDRSPISRIRRELYRWTGLARGFQSQIHQIRPDIIHAHFAEGASAALFLSRQLHVPLVLHLRGGAELLPDRELLQHAFQYPYLAFRRRLWKSASLFLCVSEYIRDKALLAGFPREKLRVQYTGMNCEAFTPRCPASEKDPSLVLYVGRLVPYKGCDYLLRAMELVQREHPKARLVVIGDGEFRHTLERLNKDLGVGCEFLGEQTQEKIRWWLERARVFCAPSVTLSDGMSEAFGNVFSEAQAMGVPVVSFRHGGIPETMRDGVTGLLANERDVDGLSAQLKRYLQDESFWWHSREEGMRWVRASFDVHDQTAKLEVLYDEVIEEFARGLRATAHLRPRQAKKPVPKDAVALCSGGSEAR